MLKLNNLKEQTKIKYLNELVEEQDLVQGKPQEEVIKDKRQDLELQ